MTPEDPQIRKVLEMLSGGASCDYQPVRGGVLVLDSAKQTHEDVAVETFLALREQGFIEKTNTLHNWHPIFRPSFQNPIDRYTITEQGKSYLSAHPHP